MIDSKKCIHFFFLLVWIMAVSCHGQNSKGDIISGKKPEYRWINYNISLDHLVDSLQLKKSHAKIVVVKSKYVLSIFIDTLFVKSYPVVFGFNATDDKLREGDGCTPEGIFKIKAKYPHKSWSKFIWFDYPNEASWKKHEQAKKKSLISKKSTIGGDVGIHGVPKGADYAIDQKQNWTLGCVSLKNKDIDEIYNFVFVGMTVEIIK